jgi:tetratricopeptide (TPR) repeat protein
MKNQFSFFLACIGLYSCSSTRLVHISVLEPAPVTMPAYIKQVGIVNRSQVARSSNAVDVIDKVVTLEGANLDKEGAQASIMGLTDELMKNDRFTKATPLTNIDIRSVVPGQFSAPLSWETVEKICRDNGTDALFVLEVFDTDTKISYATKPVTLRTPLGSVQAIEHHANMNTLVKTGWRIYDLPGKNILDEYPVAQSLLFSAKGINPAVAAAALLDRKEAIKQVSNRAAQTYALRIIPYWIRVTRDYYVRGTDNFEMARRKSLTGNWKAAGELWQLETNNPSAKIAGRACYNMAIICEINGELDKAIEWAEKAYENYNNRLALPYVRILKNRQHKNDVLEYQQAQSGQPTGADTSSAR